MSTLRLLFHFFRIFGWFPRKFNVLTFIYAKYDDSHLCSDYILYPRPEEMDFGKGNGLEPETALCLLQDRLGVFGKLNARPPHDLCHSFRTFVDMIFCFALIWTGSMKVNDSLGLEGSMRIEWDRELRWLRGCLM